MSKKANSVPAPIPDLNGFPTRERLNHANGFSAGEIKPRVSPSMISRPLNPLNTHASAVKSNFEKSLKPHEIKTLLTFVDASCLANGKPKQSSMDSGGMPKGKRSGGGLPYKMTDGQLIGWYQKIMGGYRKFEKCAVPDYVKVGLEYFYRVQIGEGGNRGLEDVGRVMGRSKGKEAIEAGYIAFYATCVSSIYHSERLIARQISEERILKNSIRAVNVKKIVDESNLKIYG